MDFQLNEEQKLLVDLADRIGRGEFAPNAARQAPQTGQCGNRGAGGQDGQNNLGCNGQTTGLATGRSECQTGAS